ncbi:metallophosphoesterase family protein [Halalkalibacter hemicellulosilyticus]|uniref:Phosphoesterase n=1 Tax=Halalkalibacter hemicellulosilyticusJCM 9152 TaxID=1236971 RepID=W4QES5_9BACI|nr:metallophosphoesterase [Halalkalibacter hemicellulosilyticus]GAE30173.1 phosphoesterase [Halalkalibacter hemicellulosilyticusJCM 9152]
MKALILSDSHGWTNEVKEILDRHRTEVDIIFHCGDSELELEHSALAGARVVKGNCDFGADFPDEIQEEVEGIFFYVTHGHLYNVKMTTDPLSYRAEEVGANVACFGHTHIATSFEHNGVIYINPGSIKLPLGRRTRTYAIFESANDESKVTFHQQDDGEIVEELTAVYK